ncbi:MAG: GTPase [Planctomycetota bacterium]|jgi:tRNA modification GTPase
MDTQAALMTGKGTGAISTIQIFGDRARAVLEKVFEPSAAAPANFETGRILIGAIRDNAKVIDQVTLGCEGPETFAIHCHGNPLIVEMIMELLGAHGVVLVTAEQLLAKTLAAKGTLSAIAIEARLAQAKAKTIEGARIVAHQIEAGLSGKAQAWLDGIEELSLDQIKAEAGGILERSEIAKLIIYGCTAALTGPPNSGKSTLLNCLAGRQKAIVTDIRGTTRDWIEAACRIGSLWVNLIDTAGLDEDLSGAAQPIEQASREKTAEILERADIILLVLDGSQPTGDLDDELIEKVSGKRVIPVLNKCDLPIELQSSRLPEFLPEPVKISAIEATGIEDLTESIRQTAGTADFDLRQPVCFTDRQIQLLTQLRDVRSGSQAVSVITQLLKGSLCV